MDSKNIAKDSSNVIKETSENAVSEKDSSNVIKDSLEKDSKNIAKELSNVIKETSEKDSTNIAKDSSTVIKKTSENADSGMDSSNIAKDSSSNLNQSSENTDSSNIAKDLSNLSMNLKETPENADPKVDMELKFYLKDYDRYECSVCLSYLRVPVLTACGHRFCKKCLDDCIANIGSKCPVDDKPLKERDMFVDRFTEREILSVQVQCPFVDCKMMLSLYETENHKMDCIHEKKKKSEEKKECTYKSYGCCAVFNDDNDLEKHLQTEVHRHVEFLSKAFSERSQISLAHKAQEAEQFWSPNKEGESSSGSSEKYLIKTLFEKIITLEQSHLQQVSKLSMELSICREIVSQIMHSGEYIWKINQFRDIIENNKYHMFYSSFIYTSFYGYRFQARINASLENENYITLVMHLVSGDYDETLDWPFSGQIMLAIVHPENSFMTVKETVMSEPELEAFKRPIKGMMNVRAFGFSHFMSKEDVYNNGYLVDDTLIVRIQVKIL